MSIKFKLDKLSPAEASLLAWQFGFHDDDDAAVMIALWQTISRAWSSDHARASEARPRTDYLKRLSAPGAFPSEVTVYLKFKSDQGEAYWLDLLKRAGLADRRQRNVTPTVERRRRPPSAAN